MNENESAKKINNIKDEIEKDRLLYHQMKSLLPILNRDGIKNLKSKVTSKYILAVLLARSLVIHENNLNLYNQKALERLDLEIWLWNELDNIYKELYRDEDYNSSIDLDLSEWIKFLVEIGSEPTESKLFDFRWRIYYLSSVTETLLEHYGDSIKITFRVKVEEDIIDFLIRLPDKRVFAMMVRSYNESYVRWNSRKKDFYVFVIKNKNIHKWTSPAKAISKLKSIFSLKKEKASILGETKTEKNAHINKVIILANGTEIDRISNDPDLWVIFGKAPALKIYTDTLTFVVEQQHLLDFLALPEI